MILSTPAFCLLVYSSRPGLICILFWSLIFIASSSAEPITLTGPTMGTTYSIQIVDKPNSLTTAALHQQIEQQLDALNATLSTYREDSEISRVHHEEVNEWLPISADLFAVLSLSREVEQQSAGAFNVAIAPLVKLWRDAAKSSPARLPTSAQIELILPIIAADGWELRHSSPALRKRTSQLRFDVNGIAPGYAVDEISRLLDDHGIANYLIELGGEIRGQGAVWQIGIEVPAEDATGQRKVLFTLPVNCGAVATSGDYRQGLEIAGKRYSHIIDPRTGWPIEQRQSSVTVVMDSCAAADAWATALFVHGPVEGIQLADQLNIAACFVVRRADNGLDDFELFPSQTFADRFPDVAAAQKLKPHSARQFWLTMQAILMSLGGLLVYWFLAFPHYFARQRKH